MALDKIHNADKNALIKDDWTITADPFEIRFKDIRLCRHCRRKTFYGGAQRLENCR